MRPVIVIGVASYRRRAQLETLIASLQAQIGVDDADVRIAVVDNSPEHDLADLSFAGARWPVRIVHEPVPGISAARNKALAIARESGADFLAFVDDDERADADWLAKLLACQAGAKADVVVGVVRGEPLASAPEWIKRARVFDMEPPAHDRAIGAGYSSNVLFRLSAARDLTFDPHFGLTGGEDTLFFAQMHKGGAVFANALDAVVREPTPEDRAKLSWLWRRWTRAAVSEGEIEMRINGASRASVFVKGVVRLGAGALMALFLLPASFGASFGNSAKGLRIAARGWGFILCAARQRIVEYSR